MRTVRDMSHFAGIFVNKMRIFVNKMRKVKKWEIKNLIPIGHSLLHLSYSCFLTKVSPIHVSSLKSKVKNSLKSKIKNSYEKHSKQKQKCENEMCLAFAHVSPLPMAWSSHDFVILSPQKWLKLEKLEIIGNCKILFQRNELIVYPYIGIRTYCLYPLIVSLSHLYLFIYTEWVGCSSC